MRASRSICTPRALPSSGRNSEYGKLEPTISSVSQPLISSQLGRVPSRPIEPVTNGTSSGTTARPSSAFATPAPSRPRPRAPRRAGAERALADEHRDALARVQDLGGAREVGVGRDDPRRARSRRPSGSCRARAAAARRLQRGEVVRDDQAGDRALRERDPSARSTRCRICAGCVAICTYSCATSLNSETRSTSCW